jgi:hypothetical protein
MVSVTSTVSSDVTSDSYEERHISNFFTLCYNVGLELIKNSLSLQIMNASMMKQKLNIYIRR